LSNDDASVVLKRQRGARTAQPQREKTLYHNVAECQAKFKSTGAVRANLKEEKIYRRAIELSNPTKMCTNCTLQSLRSDLLQEKSVHASKERTIMGTVKRTYKLDEAVLADAVALAEKKGTSVTAIIENAIRCYKDYTYMETAAFVPDQFVRQVNASLRLLEKRQNAKTNQVLSELAIQECILTFIIASNTNIPADALAMYRQKAVEFLRLNNRVFRMDESELI